jgi:ADP-sugar diphosphatase
VSVLIVLRASDDKEKGDRVLFTLQPRVPVPSAQLPELPAGMLDGSGSFSGTAAQEIEEETGERFLLFCVYSMHVYLLCIPGLKIKEDELVDMTELAYGDKWRGVYPSAGGSGM